MKIDNTRMNTFLTCPYKYYERFVVNIQPVVSDNTSLELGKRVHQLLEMHYLRMAGRPIPSYQEHTNPDVETEARYIESAYINNYSSEPFTVVDVEKVFEVEVPGTEHIYCGKFDAIVRDKSSGKLEVLEHKTATRSSNRNAPEAWAARSQATLYLWAAQIVYGEEFKDVILNVIRRPSSKNMVGPEFPPRQILERSKSQTEEAIKTLIWVADRIEECEKTGFWPSNREACYVGRYSCDYYLPHTYGWSEEIMRTKYQPGEVYLDL